jgi:phage gpG-like protein
MSLSIRDTLTPALNRRAAKIKDRRPVLEAMGLEFVSLAKRAFVDQTLRPAPWAKKKDGSPATLRKSGALFQSIRVAEVTNSTVTAASDRAYAAIHQFGGEHMPARPYFPILNGKLTDVARHRIDAVAAAKIKNLLK